MNLFKRTVKSVAHQSWSYIADSFTNFQSDRIDGTPFFYGSMPSLYTRQDFYKGAFINFINKILRIFEPLPSLTFSTSAYVVFLTFG